MPNEIPRRKTESDELNPQFDFSRKEEVHHHNHEAKIQLADVNSAFKMILDAANVEGKIDTKAVEALTSGYTDMIKAASESQVSIHTSIHANKRDTVNQVHENELARMKQEHTQNMAIVTTIGMAVKAVVNTAHELKKPSQAKGIKK